jgi:hypothetical protein
LLFSRVRDNSFLDIDQDSIVIDKSGVEQLDEIAYPEETLHSANTFSSITFTGRFGHFSNAESSEANLPEEKPKDDGIYILSPNSDSKNLSDSVSKDLITGDDISLTKVDPATNSSQAANPSIAAFNLQTKANTPLTLGSIVDPGENRLITNDTIPDYLQEISINSINGDSSFANEISWLI